MDEKTQMASQKALLMSWQQGQLEQMGQWKQIDNIVKQNPLKYDVDEWAQVTANYLETGTFNTSVPPIKAQSIDLALESNQISGTGYNVRKTVGTGTEEVTYSASESEARDFVKNVALSNEAYLKDLVKQFQGLDPQTKLQYLDTDKNGVVSKTEGQDTNPIIRWAQDTKWDKAVKKTPHPLKKTTTSGTGASATATAKAKALTGVFTPEIPYGKNVYKASYKFPGTQIIRNIPTTGADILYSEDSDALKAGNVAGRLLLYNPAKDVLVFETVGSSESADTKGTTLVEVPADNVTGVDDFAIETDGVVEKISVLRARNRANKERVVTPSVTPAKPKLY
jgi:hypothetical protein